MSISLSTDQKNALNKLKEWYKSKTRPQFITLGGYAGTGKTTLISFLRQFLLEQEPKLKVAFCCYTGKAVLVLKSSLLENSSLLPRDSISTIHGLIYSPIEEGQIIIGWERKEDIEADLIIVDEASMVDSQIWQDLLSYHLPVIAVGDHGQLPPVSGQFNLMSSPLLRLEQIHRQAKKNPIIQLSLLAREQGRIPAGNYGKQVKKLLRSSEETGAELDDLLGGYKSNTLILCGYNHTRVALNSAVRQKLGFDSPTPQSGDRIICLRNNHQKHIYNGQIGTIKTIKSKNTEWFDVCVTMDEGYVYEGLIASCQFNQLRGLNFTNQRAKTLEGDIFDFGYALTVHKAQGSQAEKVVLFEERFSKMDELDWRRWLYTGVTRAREELILIGY